MTAAKLAVTKNLEFEKRLVYLQPQNKPGCNPDSYRDGGNSVG